MGAAGGVGLATIELGKAMGAKVIAAASTQEKIDLCHKHGADEAFIYQQVISIKISKKSSHLRLKINRRCWSKRCI